MRQQKEASFNDIVNKANMTTTTKVVVNVLGWRQDAADELSGKENKSELDAEGITEQGSGSFVITVNGDDLIAASSFSEVSSEAAQVVVAAVLAVTSQASGNVTVEINTFSRGTGGGITIANMLVVAGTNPTSISMNLIAPFAGRGASNIRPGIQVDVFDTTDKGAIDFVGWMAGYSREIYQNGIPAPIHWSYGVKHQNMDTYYPGAMSSPYF